MPLFISDEELRLLGGDTAAVAERADAAIRELRRQVDTARAEADAAAIAAELTAAAKRRAAELDSSQAEVQQPAEIAKDGEVERLKVEISELHKSKCQSLELIEQRDAEIKEKDGIIQSYYDKISELKRRERDHIVALKEIDDQQKQVKRLEEDNKSLQQYNSNLQADAARNAETIAKLLKEKNIMVETMNGLNLELDLAKSLQNEAAHMAAIGTSKEMCRKTAMELDGVMTETPEETSRREIIETLEMKIVAVREKIKVTKLITLEVCENDRRVSESIEKAKDELLFVENKRRTLHDTFLNLKGKIRVFCRVRPLLPNQSGAVVCQEKGKNGGQSIQLMHKEQAYSFSFDMVFDHLATQDSVFDEISQLVQSSVDGNKVCIFAYGQTGSGKTYTMMGNPNSDVEKGMIPKSLEQIFGAKKDSQGWDYKMEVSILEIYNETIRDLLAVNRMTARNEASSKHTIKHDAGGKTPENLTIVKVTSMDEVSNILQWASNRRSVGSTHINERSSRSHCVFTLRISGVNVKGEQVQGVLNLIDLAGCERYSGASGDQEKEAKAINSSLSTLSRVINAIANKEEHVPFRDSMLTFVLQPYLEGDSKTLMFVNISPEETFSSQSLSSLRFAAQVNSCKIGISREPRK